MSLAALSTRHYSIAEWLALEQETGEKYEYHDGELWSVSAMSGGTYAHALMGGNALGEAREALKRKGADNCHGLSSDIRLKIPRQKKYVYPDAAVICEEPIFDEEVSTAICNPVIVIEVLSPSSATYDSGPKFNYYRRLKSLRDYVLVHQDKHLVEVRSRESSLHLWSFEFFESIEEDVLLPSLDLALPMAELYRGMRLSAKPATPG